MNYGISNYGSGSTGAGCGCNHAGKTGNAGSAAFHNVGRSGGHGGNTGGDLKSVVQQLTSVVSNLQRMLDAGSNHNSQAYGAGSGTSQKSGGGGCGGKSQVDQLQQLVTKLDQTYNNQIGDTNSGGSHNCGGSQGGGHSSDISSQLKDILGLLRQLLGGMQDAGGHRADSKANGAYNQLYSLINQVKQYAY